MRERMNDKNFKEMHKVLLPIIRRVMPKLIADEIVGVQPMSSRFDYDNHRDKDVKKTN